MDIADVHLHLSTVFFNCKIAANCLSEYFKFNIITAESGYAWAEVQDLCYTSHGDLPKYGRRKGIFLHPEITGERNICNTDNLSSTGGIKCITVPCEKHHQLGPGNPNTEFRTVISDKQIHIGSGDQYFRSTVLGGCSFNGKVPGKISQGCFENDIFRPNSQDICRNIESDRCSCRRNRPVDRRALGILPCGKVSVEQQSRNADNGGGARCIKGIGSIGANHQCKLRIGYTNAQII